MTKTLDQRARELLAKHYELSGTRHYADELRNGYQGQPQALAALTEALAERDKLHALLVAVVNDGTDGFAADAVSVDFLSHVPTEVKAMKAERDAHKTRIDELEGALTPNSELAGEISALIINDAITFAERREAGISASMNGALDYTTYSILQAVKRHIS